MAQWNDFSSSKNRLKLKLKRTTLATSLFHIFHWKRSRTDSYKWSIHTRTPHQHRTMPFYLQNSKLGNFRCCCCCFCRCISPNGTSRVRCALTCVCILCPIASNWYKAVSLCDCAYTKAYERHHHHYHRNEKEMTAAPHYNICSLKAWLLDYGTGGCDRFCTVRFVFKAAHTDTSDDWRKWTNENGYNMSMRITSNRVPDRFPTTRML